MGYVNLYLRFLLILLKIKVGINILCFEFNCLERRKFLFVGLIV